MIPAAPQPPGQCYLVGGAVRDGLLGMQASERDWVVVGSDQAAMEAAGYKAVGLDFPVFLHPKNGEEFALARTERRSGPGHRGFVVDADPTVSLEEDLRRRDLSVNAMARSPEGALIDPWGGQADLDKRLLRHVSEAFVEDPLRILRVARFAAKLGPWGFRLHPDTRSLLKEMVAQGMLAELSPERVWKELSRALMTDQPQRFFELLREVGALQVVLPELEAQFGVPQTAKWHPEIDAGLHTLLCLQASAHAKDQLAVRFAVLCHDFGKGITPESILPSHHGHEMRGLPLVEAVCQRLRVPKECKELALKVCQWHLHAHRAAELRPETLLKALEGLDALRRPQRLEDFLAACTADARGRTGHEKDEYPQAGIYRAALKAALSVDAGAIARQAAGPTQIPEAIRKARTEAIAALPRGGAD
ncbi:MAG: multifunctional CCA addition/repair protein [Oceanococcaceae bacterium]